MNKENHTIASEIIVDLRDQIVTLDGRIEAMYEDIKKTQALFHAVQYTASEGGMTRSEINAAMSGIQVMLNVLTDNVEETLGISNKYVEEVTG